MKTLQWMLTGKCNLNCRHCYLDLPAQHFAEPTTAELLRRVERMAASGCRSVILTGGEPLVRPDLEAVLTALTEHGIRIERMITNGTLLQPEHLNLLEQLNQRPVISVSYDGDGGVHDWLRNRAGAAQQALDALRMCRERGFPVMSEMTLFKANGPVLHESLRTLASVGCASVKVMHLVPTGAGKRIREQVLTPQELLQCVCEEAVRYRADALPMELYLDQFLYTPGAGKGWAEPARLLEQCRTPEKVCLCARDAATPFLTSDGRLLPCAGLCGIPDASEFAATPEASDFTAAMECPAMRDFLSYTVERQGETNEACGKCCYLLSCGGGCRLAALAMGGSRNGRDPYLCAYFRGNWRERIRSAVQQGRLESLLHDSTGAC